MVPLVAGRRPRYLAAHWKLGHAASIPGADRERHLRRGPHSSGAVPAALHVTTHARDCCDVAGPGGRERWSALQAPNPWTGADAHRVSGCVPVVANGGDTGYYRVQYDAANMARLRAAYLQLPATERIGLIADTMALASSGVSGSQNISVCWTPFEMSVTVTFGSRSLKG